MNNNTMPLRLLFPKNRFHQFWMFQALGWSGLSVISFFSLNLWYNQPQADYIGHNILQSILGVFVSWPLRAVFRRLWHYKFWPRFGWGIAAVILASSVWAMLRLELFMVMTGETGLWRDFGGWLFASIFIFLCWSALYHGIKYNRLLQEEHASLLELQVANHEAGLQTAKAEAAAKEAQFKMLRYQLNPHFLFNTLNAISSLVQADLNQQANQMIIQLSSFLRYSLDNDPLLKVPLEKELTILQSYLEIEQTRFSDRLRLQFDIAAEAKRLLVPSLILQPLIENAIKYAIAPAEDGGTIFVSAKINTDAMLHICVADTGANRRLDIDSISISKGVGLNNTEERLQVYYGDTHQFYTQRSDIGGLSVNIVIPQEYHEQEHQEPDKTETR